MRGKVDHIIFTKKSSLLERLCALQIHRVLNVFGTVGVAVLMAEGYLVELCVLIRCDEVEPVLS
jgi:hypothetical protein